MYVAVNCIGVYVYNVMINTDKHELSNAVILCVAVQTSSVGACGVDTIRRRSNFRKGYS